MKVLISGSHGLIGSSLQARLTARGDAATALVRHRPTGSGEDHAVAWDPANATIDRAGLEAAGPFDAVVHLAGAGIADRRWSPERRRLLVDSRVDSTTLLSETLASLREPPAVLVSASATGYYGDRGAELLTEASPPGQGFLAELCQAWEGATGPADAAGIRVVHLRTGIVLAGTGGMVGQLLPIFRLGLGGRLGTGRQWVSWISLADAVSVILRAIADPGLGGPVNATAPAAVTNRELTRSLARALHRPAVLAVPRRALSATLGPDMAAEMLFCSQRVSPAVLVDGGFEFTHPDIAAAMTWAAAIRR